MFVENRLFATLDPTTRYVPLGGGTDILMTDTVGFIRKLPHHLVASFKSTLEEITEADILLHVVDVSSATYDDQIRVVEETLEDLGAGQKPTLMVFNKVDRLPDRSVLARIGEQYPSRVFISATRGINISGFKEEVLRLVQQEFVVEQFTLPQTEQRVISRLFDAGEVLEKVYEDNSVTLRIRIPRKERERLHQLAAGRPSSAR